MPGTWLLRSTGISDSSVTGRASMSARSATTGAEPDPIVATTPGADTSSNDTPIALSSRFTTADVFVSVHISSGCRWSSRRTRTT